MVVRMPSNLPSVLRIRRSEDAGSVIFALSGRIEETEVPDLKDLVEAESAAGITIDLDEVRLVDRQAVQFLAACETRGITLRNCPAYIREWIEKGAISHD
jgi:STAS domain